MEPAQIFYDDKTIERARDRAIKIYAQGSSDGSGGGMLHKCGLLNEKGKFCFGDEAKKRDYESEARRKDIASADIICLGGVLDIGPAIGMLPAKIMKWFADKGRPLSASMKIVAYDSEYHKSERIHDAYEWNRDKTYISPEMETLGEKIWEAKFLDNSQRHLIAPDQFKGFAFLTQSFGARMSFMIENHLREKLTAKLSEMGYDSAAVTSTIQKYFDRIRRVSVSSAVDVEGLSDKTKARQLQPSIATTHIISQSDRGIAYRKDFHDKCIASDICKDQPYVKREAKELFGHDGENNTIIILKREPDDRDLKANRGHGFIHYVDIMSRISDADVQLLADDLSIGARGHHIARRRTGGAPHKDNPQTRMM